MSDVENFNVNMNLVGFGLDATEKFTKQIDTINRMNAAQDRLKYVWGVGKQIQNCQVHFVISSPLPAYLENTSDPVLTNQNIETDNIIPCPYPVTTFDLMDILAYVESLIPESRAQIQQDTEQEEQDEENQDEEQQEEQQQEENQEENSDNSTETQEQQTSEEQQQEGRCKSCCCTIRAGPQRILAVNRHCRNTAFIHHRQCRRTNDILCHLRIIRDNGFHHPVRRLR